MPKLFSRITFPSLVVLVIVAINQTAAGFYQATGAESPPLSDLLGKISLFWGLGWWIRDDSRKRQFAWVYDLGFFLYLAWPVVTPYYLFKTRGVRALLTIGAFILVIIVAFLFGVALSVMLGP